MGFLFSEAGVPMEEALLFDKEMRTRMQSSFSRAVEGTSKIRLSVYLKHDLSGISSLAIQSLFRVHVLEGVRNLLFYPREKLNTASLSTMSLDRDTHFCQAIKSK